MRRWRPVVGFPNYIVSDDGQVKRRTGGPGARAGLLLKPGKDCDGYYHVCLYKGSRSSQTFVKTAVLVLTAFIKPRPEGMEACHNNGNPSDDRLSNLRWDTHSANVLDAVSHGTHVSNAGSNNGRSKITEWDALDIYDRVHAGHSLKSLAAEYGLHPEYVRLIKKGKHWSHLYALVI